MTWAIPSWWPFLLLALAAWRIWRLLAYDTILNSVRRRVVWFRTDDEVKATKRSEFIECPFCAGFWVALAWWLFWVAWPHWTLVVAVPFALSALVALVAVNGDPD